MHTLTVLFIKYNEITSQTYTSENLQELEGIKKKLEYDLGSRISMYFSIF